MRAAGVYEGLRVRTRMSYQMRDPRADLRSLVERGQALQRDVETLVHEAKLLNPRLAMGRTVLRLLDVDARRSLIALGRFFGAEGLANRWKSLLESFEEWYQEAVALVRTISLARKNLTVAGNSPVLAKRLARARKYKRLDTQITHAVGELQTLAEEELVYNDEIPELLAQRRKQALEERRRAKEANLLDLSDLLPGMESVKLGNREQLRTHFGGHPEVARMIEGALDAYSFPGADANRQALASCRSAIEQATFEATGERNFRAGLARIATGTRRKLIGNTYDFLSGYGSHPGGTLTKEDVAYGIRMAIASCSWILKHHRPQ